ncbi:MAG: outer membrane beta-barrel protein [Deltaproteobacteria bacterium]|nr:outer membrane beta-barrel protein [Deltaproteobacteria bacterium]
MKKHLYRALFAASLVASGTVWANGTPAPEPVAGGLEISGNVTIVSGYQHDDQDATGGALGGMGDVTFATAANADHFRFIVDQVEIDLQKSFGENIRLRADIDFVDFANTNTRVADAYDLEQAYVTANLAAGNGIEFLIGKFNAPVGVESADRADNWFISYQFPYRFLTPTALIGAKLYYAFSDLIDLHYAVTNDLNANGFGDSAIPASLFRLGFNWGEEGHESTVGISGGFSPESDAAIAGGASQNAHWDFFGDLDALIAVSDTWTVAFEGVYRQSDNIVAASKNQKAIAGWIGTNWQINDAWDFSMRGGWMWEINPITGSGASTTGGFWNGTAATGHEGNTYSGQLGTGYMITDGAKMKLEYRFDFAAVAGPAANSDYHSLMAEFDYSF